MAERISHSLVQALRGVPDFADLTDKDRLAIVGASANLFWPAGSLVFETGSPSEALYVVLSGAVRVYETQDGREVEVAWIGPGDFFGELSLLLDTMHTKNAQAIEDTELLVLPKESFQELLASNPDLAERVRRKMEQRQPSGEKA